MTDWLLNPALVMILGGLLLPVLRDWPRRVLTLALPAIALTVLCLMPHGLHGSVEIFGLPLKTIRLDRLAYIFALIFLIAAVLAGIYALHVRDPLQQAASQVYAGAALGAVLAGDLITLVVFWELTALSSVLLIWARRTERAYRAGMRYLAVQVTSGVVLLAGAAWQFAVTGDIGFEAMQLSDPGAWLILLAFGIKCAFPLLHNWMHDAYPEATITGTVVLSIFTTKLAVYALARGFPGTELLIPIGAAMAAFPIFFAVIENDMRRVLTYSLNNQLGFMVVGVGVGSQLAIDGAAAHAFSHILYKSLLFMSMGAVLYRVGTVKASELGGLFKSMPWTASFCIVGSLSISAFPLFSGFVTKSMIITAVAEEHRTVIMLTLLFASAGVFHHAGIKIPFFAFFAHDSGKRCQEAPLNMLIAMGVIAALCIGIGMFPGPLYALLPYGGEYSPYTTTHVLTQLQLLMFSALAFTVLMRSGIYPPELPSVNLDFDWFYRRALPGVWRGFAGSLARVRDELWVPGVHAGQRLGLRLLAPLQEGGSVARPWSTSTMVLIVAVVLGLFLLQQVVG